MRRKSISSVFALVPLMLSLQGVARGQGMPPGYSVHTEVDVPILIGAVMGTVLVSLFPFGHKTDPVPPGPEWFAFDEPVKDTFSDDASAVSDVLLFSSVIAPVGAGLATGVDEGLAEGALLYAQTLAITGLVTQLTKHTVSRPRPYMHHRHPDVIARREKEEGLNPYLSFFSGHSSLAFSSAVGGSALFSMRTVDVGPRAAVWGFEMAFASATAALRVRAGRHYPSDVIVGVLVGSAAGALVPALHVGEGSYEVHVEEWLAMGGGALVGTVFGVLFPFSDVLEAGPEQVSLMPLTEGAGLALSFSL